MPETARTARDLPLRLRQVARHDPLMALRLIYQMFSNSSLFQRPSTLVGRRGGYCVELSLRRERPAAADYLDFRSSSAIHTESDMSAPIWSPNDQLVIFKWISDSSAKIAGTPYTRR